MAMGPERSKPLHNFTLPCLKWGNQRHLRCMKVSSDASADADGTTTAGDRRYPVVTMRSEQSTASRKRELETERKQQQQYHVSARDSEKRMRISSKSRIDGDGGEDGIEAVREKIMFDLKTAADKMKDAILRKEAPIIAAGGSGKGLKIEEKKLNHSPSRTDVVVAASAGGGGNVKSPKLRVSPDKAERPKFSVSLSKKEIEEDFMEMIGHRPPRRPKKRHRNVQKDLDTLFPGLWLTEIEKPLQRHGDRLEHNKTYCG
ncbi:histone acetyltransferase KAT6B [Senna tora]|uniref:Histone acetyltransferase KAT6B n=1 Tax=Senna tora TaxID=362788 RepID=A0A834TTG1_9FABA|nr:histone acetyltransferase KAT6B [Senna tora]